MIRTIWKGHIQFSLVTIPVRIYNGIDTDESGIKFNQLHKEDSGPVGYDKKCKKCNKVLASDDIVKGYQYEPGQYVVMRDEDLASVRLKSTKVIAIEAFVDASEIDPALYESVYFAGPDGEVAGKPFALLAQVLADTGKVGIGKVVIRDREDVVLLTAHDKKLVLYKLRYPNEVRDIREIPVYDGKVDKEQAKLAKTLVASMTMPFSKVVLKNNYLTALKEIIDARIAGHEVVSNSTDEVAVAPGDVMELLRKSIEESKKLKVAA